MSKQNNVDQQTQEMREAWQEMHQQARELKASLEDLRRATASWRDSGWSSWESHKLVWPRKINGRWYWPGNVVYRQERIRGLTGSRQYRYGDEFDLLKEQHDNV